MMIVMAVIAGRMIVMGMRRMRVGAMRVIMMLDGVAARIARMGAEDRNQPREDSADQRQKDDCLNHRHSPSMILPENRFPPIGSEPEGMLFGIMR
jgi:hypothetical protein